MSKHHYGGTCGELHPEREDAVSLALERFEADSDTSTDRVLLFMDVEVCRLQSEVERLWKLLKGARKR